MYVCVQLDKVPVLQRTTLMIGLENGFETKQYVHKMVLKERNNICFI